MWNRLKPRAGNLRWWQLGVLIAVFGLWHVRTKPGLVPPFLFSDDTQAAFFFGEPLKIATRIVNWFFVARDIYGHLAVTLLADRGTLYVNGVVAGTNPAMLYAPYHLGAGMDGWIGRSQYPADPYLKGRVDEFRNY